MKISLPKRSSLSTVLFCFSLSVPVAIFTGCAQAQAPAQLPAQAPVQLPAQLTNVARQSEPGAPYINTWLLLGTFDNDAANSGYNRAFIDETGVAPQDGQAVGGQTWRYFDDRLFSRNYDDYNDLFSYFDIKQKVSAAAKVVYAHSYVYSPIAQNVQLRVGADTGFKAWVNGVLVGASTQAGPTVRTPGEDQILIGGRDFVVVPATLNVGWNRLLLKISNTENGRFGFYARFTTLEGNEPRGLEYSTSGGRGELAIENRAMPEAKTGVLPIAWREWPYVEAQPDTAGLRAMGPAKTGPEGQKPPGITGLGIGLKYNVGTVMSSSVFKLSARGGQLPLVWSKTKGELPDGMTLENDGAISGTPAAGAKLGDYTFTAQVRDKTGKTATREYSLTLNERPNRAIESGRLIGLMHGPENISIQDRPKQVRQMKREGYTMGIPLAYHNGDLLFRWPTKFSSKKTPTDVMADYKKNLEAEGIGFGMYFGPLDDVNEKEFTLNQQILVMQEAMETYHPKALWFDWLGGESSSLDSLFSVIRSIDPNVVIIMNGSERPTNGDWDIMNYEGWGAWNGLNTWNVWPALFPWPKKYTASSWRISVDPQWTEARGITSDWNEMLRVQLSLIGEGFIADMDHTPSLSPLNVGPRETWPLVIQHEKMGDWASPKGLPPLYEAYTHVDPGPLKAASWGYNTMNLKRDAVYLLALKNRRRKTGLPSGGKLAVGAIDAKVKSVTLMNANKPLPFSQDAQTGALSINIQNVTPDEVATIIKIALETPLPADSSLPVPSLTAANSPTPAGNIATGKPSWLMSADDSHELEPTGGRYAVYGVDGDPDSYAQPRNEYAWSYKVDLKKAHTISRVALWFGGRENVWTPEYVVLVSLDGKQWTRVLYVVEGRKEDHDFNIAPVQARWIRVQAIKPNGPGQPGGQMGIGELQVFETALAGVPVTPLPRRAANLASEKPSRLLSRDGMRELEPSTTSIASNGTDGKLNTWAQASGDYAWTYHVDLGEIAQLRRIAITFTEGGWATQYGVFVSSDGENWKTVAQVNDNKSGGLKMHAFATVEARYVRVQALKPDGPNQPGGQMTIAEVQAFDTE